MKKERLDELLVLSGLAPSREKAQAMVLANEILVNDAPAGKAGEKIPVDSILRLREKSSKFVGRGGDKLAEALDHFRLSPAGMVAIDVGSSTGGFTDCLLQNGAAKVYAVDVGTNQLDYQLRVDKRVVVMEQTHVKDLAADAFEPPPQFVTIDVSFISLSNVLPEVSRIIAAPASILALVKPQFEVPREMVGPGGLVADELARMAAVEKIIGVGAKLGYQVSAPYECSVHGAKSGNHEYFLLFTGEPNRR